MRSIKPLAGLTSERLREFVDCICTLPSDRWLDTFGENTYFARGGLGGYIQSELTIARAHRAQQIAAGEFLDNDTWNALRDFTQQARIFIRPASDGQLNETLSQLEDFIDVRPPQKEAKTLVDRFLRAMCKPGANELAPWGTGFATAQKLSDQINAIQTGDTPQRSSHEVITATESQKATHSENAPRYFVFGSPTDSTSTQKSQNKLKFSELLSLLQEIENKASFFREVDTEGPRYTGGRWGKLTFVVNAFGTIGGEILSAARHGKPATLPYTAVGFPLENAEQCMNPSFHTYTRQSKIREQDTGATSTGELNQLSLKDGYAWKASLLELEAVVNDFIASIKPPTGTGSEKKISNDPGAAEAPTSSSDWPMLDRLAQSISDVLGAIDDALTFPSASALTEDIPMLDRQRLEALAALDAAERGDPLYEDQVYGPTVESSPSWRETLAPAINQLVSQLASVLNTFGGYAVGTAASGYQLARNNPATTAGVGLAGGAFLTALGTYLTFFKEQLPEQPPADIEPTDTLAPLENGAALTQQQIDDELGSDEATSVVTQPNLVSTPIAIPTSDRQQPTRGLATTVDTTVTTETVEVTTPIESSTLPQEQLDQETTVEPGDIVPYEDLPETAAAHQQRIDDEIERILETPLAEDLQPLSQSILELMYESPEKLILLQEVKALLKQHAKTNPGQSYSEQIQEVLAEDSASHEAVDQPSDSGVRSSRSKREADYAGGMVAAIANTQSADVEDNASNDEAELNDYLVKMNAMQGPDIDTFQGIDSAVDPEIAAAMEAVRVMRSRRSAVYTDISRADGDKQLAARYAAALRQSGTTASAFAHSSIHVPTHSTFGQCWLNYLKAIRDPFFTDWAAEVGLDLTTVKVDVVESELTGTVNGTTKTFSLTDNSGWAYHAPLILDAAQVVDPMFDQVPYPSSDGKVPVMLVGGFYAENRQLSATQSLSRANELDRQEAFSEVSPDDPIRPLEPRTEAILKRDRRRLGNHYNHHALILALNDLIKGKSDDALVDLTETRIPIDPDSTFAAKHPVDAQRMVLAQTFISDNPWLVPKNVAEIRNLINVLSFPAPRSPYFENYRGVFGDPTPLTTTQVALIQTTVEGIPGYRRGSGLLKYLLPHTPMLNADHGLIQALRSTRAQELGKQLVTRLGFISTQETETGLVLAALLLDLDPAVGARRNHVAGYDLAKDTNVGKKPSEVIADLERHLINNPKLDARTAPVAAYHFVSALAPEFQVKGLPDNLVCGSDVWAMLRLSVARIESVAKGAPRNMNYEDAIQYGALLPISLGEDINVRALSEPPLVDWAVANGIIAKSASGEYTDQQKIIARQKFQENSKNLADARTYLQAAVPMLEDYARADLIQVLGPDVLLENVCITEKRDKKEKPAGPPLTTSLLDAHMSGLLQSGKWESSDPEVDISALEPKFKDLKNVTNLFARDFPVWYHNIQKGSASEILNLFAQLSVEDRKNLEYGQQTFYSVRTAVKTSTSLETPAEELMAMRDNEKGIHGIIIRSEYKGEVIWLELFPGAQKISKNLLLPNTLERGLSYSKAFYLTAKLVEQGTDQPVDFEAYLKGTPPRENVTSNVIFDEIEPTRWLDRTYPTGFDFDAIPNTLSPDSRSARIAHVVVQDHFINDEIGMSALAKGKTLSMERDDFDKTAKDFLLGLVPFKTAIDKIQEGKYSEARDEVKLDLFGNALPFAKAGSKVAKIVASSVIRSMPKALKSAWVVSKAIVINANPLDGFGDLIGSVFNTAGRLSAAAYRGSVHGLNQLAELFGTTKAISHADLIKRADIAEGATHAAEATGQSTQFTARFIDGKWFAFDRERNRAYGAALENFSPDSSITLERTTFSDGSTALTNSRLFDAKPHVIHRSTHTDVVVGEKVYRLDPENPGVLNDLSSPVFFKQVEGFEDVCSLGRISKRTGNLCFSKKVVGGKSRRLKRLQSIQHKRLFPSLSVNGSPRQVIQERRLFTVSTNNNIQTLIPSPLKEPLQYKLHTTGKIIPDKHFGLPNKEVDADLDKNTRVVKLDGIVHGVDDQRDARGFLVNYDYQNTGMKSYLVVESDTGLFYYCDYDAATVNNLAFKKIDLQYSDSLDNGLITEHDKLKDQYLIAAGISINNDFVALPPLDSIYMDLILKKGFTHQKISDLKAKTALLTDEKKREFILAVWNRGNIQSVEVAASSIKVEPIAKRPGFNQLSATNQNKVYAEQAKSQVDEQFKATGLRSANQVIANDPTDIQRQVLSSPVVIWVQSKADSPDYADVILRTGAGNCDQMAWAAKKIIDESGGIAEIWQMTGHTFTVVGVPSGTIGKTVDFSEPAFKDAWVVDPWGGISCPAKEFIVHLDLRMLAWQAEGKMLLAPDTLNPTGPHIWESPTDPEWINDILNGEKFPMI